MHYFFDENLTRTERVNKREEEILKIIQTFIEKNHHSPSIRDILKKSSLKSTSTVLVYLNRLKDKGIINWQPKTSKSFYLVDQTEKNSVG